jgi:NAD(P)-dependent dehydrogenase (short-subunit alcohol dehydrogenase family)
MMDNPWVLQTVAGIFLIVFAGQFDNHMWRVICCVVGRFISTSIFDGSTWYSTGLWLLMYAAMLYVPHLEPSNTRQGCVLVTGADSGMGQATVVHLAKTNRPLDKYDRIFAGCFNPKASLEALEKLLGKELMKKVVVVPLDVTSDESVKLAAQKVTTAMADCKSIGLLGLINFHGVAYNGPVEYMPLSMYQRQLDVNYLGNIRMTQAFLPLMKQAAIPTQPGRLIFTGTGGGPCTPCPPLLSAYMSSKFAGEAYAQSLRMELDMRKIPVDCLVINPGFVKPTMLMEEGAKLTEKMWKACEDESGNTTAKDEFGPLMKHFVQYSTLQPGTPVHQVCLAAEHALTSHSPRSSYKVGMDSKLAPLAGMLPTGMREYLTIKGIYGSLSPAGTVQGYKTGLM